MAECYIYLKLVDIQFVFSVLMILILCIIIYYFKKILKKLSLIEITNLSWWIKKQKSDNLSSLSLNFLQISAK